MKISLVAMPSTGYQGKRLLKVIVSSDVISSNLYR